MFRIVNSEIGNRANKNNSVHDFLSSLLIEVATENYRQLMFEQLMFSANKSGENILLDPPLRANERVMSGLFSIAISRVAARSKPEVRIDRIYEPDDDSEDENPKTETSTGRVDFLVWYNSSTIALELKVAYINWASPKITEITKKRWSDVVAQAETAHEALIDRQNERYPSPHSIGLMILVSRSAVKATEKTIENGKEKKASFTDEHITQVTEMLNRLEPQPDFIATYTFPAEFRNFVRKRKGKENEEGEQRSTPFVTFIAYVAK